MRAVVAMAVLLLAGCTQPSPKAFEPTCPAWSEGPSHDVYNKLFDANRTTTRRSDELGTGRLRDEGRPLDRIALDFHPRNEGGAAIGQGIDVQDARLTLRLHHGESGESLAAYDPAFGPQGATNPGKESWTFEPGTYTNFTLYVDLGDGGPAPILAVWEFAGNLDGVPTTASVAYATYRVDLLYRVC